MSTPPNGQDAGHGHGRRPAPFFPALLAAALVAGSVGAASILDPAPDWDALVVEVSGVSLNPADPGQASVGRLGFRGGLWLRSDDPRFGGLSDLRLAADRSSLLAVSDCGSVLEAGLVYDEQGRLSGLASPRIGPLRGPLGQPVRDGEVDAEALAHDGEGGFVVAFEGRPRLLAFPAPGGLRGPGRELPVPGGLGRSGGNSGVEAMVRLADGRLLLLTEASDDSRGAAGWIGRGDDWTAFEYPLVRDPGHEEPFRPTSAALLPGTGDVLVLERRYPPVAVRIRRVPGTAFERGAGLEGVEVARLEPPLSVDNFEGLDVVPGPGDEVRVFLVSDDNDCAKRPGALRRSAQRTLLLAFALP